MYKYCVSFLRILSAASHGAVQLLITKVKYTLLVCMFLLCNPWCFDLLAAQVIGGKTERGILLVGEEGEEIVYLAGPQQESSLTLSPVPL